MHLSLYQQGEIFRCAFLFGVCLGAYYDLFRLLRAMGFSSKSSVFLQDIVFSCTASVMCFLFAQTAVHGHFRLFVMAAHVSGLAAYRCCVGIVTGKLYKKLGKMYRRVMAVLNGAVCRFSKRIAETYSAIHGKITLKRRIRLEKRQNSAKNRIYCLFLRKRKNF